MTDTLTQRARDVAGQMEADALCNECAGLPESAVFYRSVAAIISELVERIEGLEREVDFLESSFLDERD